MPERHRPAVPNRCYAAGTILVVCNCVNETSLKLMKNWPNTDKSISFNS